MEQQNSSIDADLLYVSKTNLNWRNMVIEKCLDECSKLGKELDCLKQILDNDVKCIDVKILGNKDQANRNLKEIETTCLDKL